MKYQVITSIPETGEMFRHEMDDVRAWAAGMGIEQIGTVTSTRVRPELQGQPRFAGLFGPAAGEDHAGNFAIRYEDDATHRELSQ